tara:strand:+ start:2690 stop:3637 length:948 start_codon:yes stop_codon:yes gene_type:complete
MNKEYSNNNQIILDDELDLLDLLYDLWNGKWIIITFTAFASIVGLMYSLLLPDIYESKATLIPADSSSGISRSLQNYAGLAGLAGISIPSGADNIKSKQAIHKLSSLSFFENNIMPNIFLPDLMALKSWDQKTNTLNYDESIYNEKTNAWIRDHSSPSKRIPSAQESFQLFRTQYLNISEDTKNGFITLSVKHQSPFIAKEWAELLINQIHNFYRQKDKSESNKAISYLNQQISKTNISEVKDAISQLLKEETKKLALIEANEFYIFEYIDPPAVMETKSQPKRSLICILSALLGGILGIIFVLLKKYFSRLKYS